MNTRKINDTDLLLRAGALVGQLGTPFKMVIELEGDYKTRAEAMGCTVGTVKSRLHRARAKLEALIAQRDANGEA